MGKKKGNKKRGRERGSVNLWQQKNKRGIHNKKKKKKKKKKKEEDESANVNRVLNLNRNWNWKDK